MANVYKGAVGVTIKITNLGDISTSTVRQIKVVEPDGTAITWPAEGNATLGADDKSIEYTTVATNLDQAGDYKLHPWIEGVGTFVGAGDMVTLPVYELHSR